MEKHYVSENGVEFTVDACQETHEKISNLVTYGVYETYRQSKARSNRRKVSK